MKAWLANNVLKYLVAGIEVILSTINMDIGCVKQAQNKCKGTDGNNNRIDRTDNQQVDELKNRNSI